MKPGDVSPVLRSASGFHIVKLIDKRGRNEPTVVDQTHARHILIKVNELVSEADGKVKIDRLKDRLDAGAKFDELAKLNSEDASAAKGGDLGWLNPGDTVPEFQDAHEQAGDQSDLRACAHSVRLAHHSGARAAQAGRHVGTSSAPKRNWQFASARPTKQFQAWVREVRDRAYVEIRLDDK